ncbi:polyprenol phosphomannose-dependent alpha 1,6 mannosyltransferase MptB, partial [Frankia sp. AgB32]|uniref:polyprenol phosphomannose-dependent alpha 1,6 mannosyltransferase MptB n=1 Tax=Frankia sp. AgB32 TaxID=631119 RepID=UPI002010819C
MLLRGALAGRVTTRGGLTAAVTWSLPFAVGPPLYSRDAYAYAAQGELARLGLDPATHGVSALRAAGTADGSGLGFVRAVDPRWTDTHSPYGSAAVAIEKAAAALGDGPGGTVVTLRVIAVLATVALVVLALRLAGTGHRAIAAVAVAANPVIVIHLVGGSHLDALAAALVVAALVLDRAAPGPTDRTTAPTATDPDPGEPGLDESRPGGAGRSWAVRCRPVAVGAAATGLAGLAGNVKATALLAVGWLMVSHLLAARRAAHPVRAGLTRLAADVGAVAAVSAVSMAAAGFGPSWIHSLSTSGKLSTGIAPASILAAAVDGLCGLLGWHLPDGAALRVARGLCLAAAAAVVLTLTIRAWRHGPGERRAGSPLDERPDLAVLGFGGLAVALGSPVVYPWYLAMCLPPLAVIAAMAVPADRTVPAERGAAGRSTATRPAGWRSVAGLVPTTAAGRTLAGTVLVSSWLCLATLPPLAATWRLLGGGGVLALVGGLGLGSGAGGGGGGPGGAPPAPPPPPGTTRVAPPAAG